jgi:hypothetical protein
MQSGTKNILIGLVILVAIAAGLLFYHHSRPRMTVHDVDSLIHRVIPVGTISRVAILNLDSAKIEHSIYDEKQGMIRVIIYDSKLTTLLEHTFVVKLQFDANHRLVSHSTQEFFIGP